MLVLFLGLFAALSACQSTQKVVNGSLAPAISLPNTAAQPLSLSAVGKGKYVLVDFWASWCKPCREAHPELVKIYNKYKDARFGNASGFTIYSVSLDTKRPAWLHALQADQLPYADTAVNDTLGFKSPCLETYGFRVIPTSYLLDENGRVIGNNLSLKWLDYELSRRVTP